MSYNPATDFLALWRNNGANVSKLEMPGLDFVVAALARAGIVTVSVSGTAPVANQSTTAWLQTAAPSSGGEGALRLWDATASAYAAATPALFLAFLEACAGDSGVSWWTSTGGPPLNTVGNNGDLAIRTDQPGGIYGPKALGAWPASPLPGTTSGFVSEQLDAAFGAVTGNMLYRGASEWQGLPIGAANEIMSSTGAAPFWRTLTSVLDTLGVIQGSVLYRGAAGWAELGPGTANQFLGTNGPGADPSYKNAYDYAFPAGTVMLFVQTAAPTGWTKLVAVDDAGLRLTSGAVSQGGSSGFSVVFAQTATGAHTLTVAEMPSHHHSYGQPVTTEQKPASGGNPAFISPVTGSNTGDTGGDGAHSHTINLTLKYVDVIMAQKN